MSDDIFSIFVRSISTGDTRLRDEQAGEVLKFIACHSQLKAENPEDCGKTLPTAGTVALQDLENLDKHDMHNLVNALGIEFDKEYPDSRTAYYLNH